VSADGDRVVTQFWIPQPYREPLSTLAQLPDDTASKLIQSIRALEAYAPVSRIQAATEAILGTDAAPGEKQLGLPLLALRGQLRQATPEDIAERLSQSSDLELDPPSRDNLRSRAAEILATPVYETTAVATDLQTQNARNYQSARIVTDVRPIFQEDVEAPPTGAVIVETLQIQTWTRDGGSELIFVSMDETDLKQLKATIDRALSKTDTLKKFIDEKGLSYFELEKEVVD
jgi:hypothetical protein